MVCLKSFEEKNPTLLCSKGTKPEGIFFEGQISERLVLVLNSTDGTILLVLVLQLVYESAWI